MSNPKLSTHCYRDGQNFRPHLQHFRSGISKEPVLANNSREIHSIIEVFYHFTLKRVSIRSPFFFRKHLGAKNRGKRERNEARTKRFCFIGFIGYERSTAKKSIVTYEIHSISGECRNFAYLGAFKWKFESVFFLFINKLRFFLAVLLLFSHKLLWI